MWSESTPTFHLPQANLPPNFSCDADVECESSRCACSEYGLRGTCAPVSQGMRCGTTTDCAQGLSCVQDPLVTSLFPQTWCKGVCVVMP
jgi:hypothetical protein